jgi:glutathione-regulated potassium-efflux system ancillary protein KefG
MGRRVDIDSLIDVGQVASILGLSHKNSVSTYSKRYPDFPRPVVTFADQKCRLWLRPEIESWVRRDGRGKDR